jgi:stress response protein YsnF
MTTQIPDEDKAAQHVVPLSEETAHVETRSHVTGRVRVSTVTDTVDEVVAAELEDETVEVTRVLVNREVVSPPPIRTEGDTTIIPVLEEVLVVEKRLVLKEELYIRRRVSRETVEMPVQVRKQRAVVERVEAPSSTTSKE